MDIEDEVRRHQEYLDGLIESAERFPIRRQALEYIRSTTVMLKWHLNPDFIMLE